MRALRLLRTFPILLCVGLPLALAAQATPSSPSTAAAPIAGLSDRVKEFVSLRPTRRTERLGGRGTEALDPKRLGYDEAIELVNAIYGNRPTSADLRLLRELLAGASNRADFVYTDVGQLPTNVGSFGRQLLAASLPESLYASPDSTVRKAIREAKFVPQLTAMAFAGGAVAQRLKTLWRAEEATLIDLGINPRDPIHTHSYAVGLAMPKAGADVQQLLRPILYEAFMSANAAAKVKVDTTDAWVRRGVGKPPQ